VSVTEDGAVKLFAVERHFETYGEFGQIRHITAHDDISLTLEFPVGAEKMD
jgi:hypothetical protein